MFSLNCQPLPSTDQFTGFGPCCLAARPQPLAEVVLPADRRAARKLLRRQCLATPGVYGMIDADGILIYVGKSKSLRDRLLSYFAAQPHDVKASQIIGRAKRLVWEPAPHEFAALLRELELIRRWRPRLNVQGQPKRNRRSYVRLACAPAPHACLAPGEPDVGELAFGPLPGNRHFRRAVAILNDCFRLRTCSQRVPIHFADPVRLFGDAPAPRCLRHAIGICLAPCAAQCHQQQYANQVEAARRFLDGSDTSLLHRLRRAVFREAAALRYEHAAALQSMLETLTELNERLARFRRVRQGYSFVYRLPDRHGRELWYLIRRGQVAAATRPPRDREAASRKVQLLRRVFAHDRSQTEPQMAEDFEMLSLVAGWFRRYPDELQRTIPPQEALRTCLS
jgi:excinuclease ABC subunit C